MWYHYYAGNDCTDLDAGKMESGIGTKGFGNYTAEGALSAYANGHRGEIVQGACKGAVTGTPRRLLDQRSVAYPDWGPRGGFITDNKTAAFKTDIAGLINNF